MYCKNFKAMLKSRDSAGNTLITRTRCKQWTCSYCSQINRKQWNARLIDFVNKKGGDWGWFTLTAHGQKRSPKASLDNLRSCWDKFIKRLKRKYGKFDYCRVYEPHKDGAYHLHCIVSFHFDDLRERKGKDNKTVTYSKQIASIAKKFGIGWYTHADNIAPDKHGGYVASYITKYITKLTIQNKKEIGRTRHIQCSHTWSKLTKISEYKWEVATGIYEDDLNDAIDRGKDVIDINTGEKLTYDDFDGMYIYPSDFNVDDETYFGKILRDSKKE